MKATDVWPPVAAAIADGLRIRAGERVGIFLTDVQAIDLLADLCREIYRRGAEPHVLLTEERIDRIAALEADISALELPSPIEASSLRSSDVHISLRGMVPPDEFSEAASARALAAQRKAKGAISTLRWQETRWAIVRVPTVAWAEYVHVPYDRLVEEFAAGCLFDWNASANDWARLARRIDDANSVTITGPDTELHLSIRGRSAALFAGEANWPDGEVATAPVETDVQGFISFPEEFVFASRVIRGLRLEFVDGLVVRADAELGGDFVQALLDTDDGSRRVGELGIGLNPAMSTMTRDLFFDEKILGTVHIALGRAYPQCGGINESSLHWDIVKDLRPGGGRIIIDGTTVLTGDNPSW